MLKDLFTKTNEIYENYRKIDGTSNLPINLNIVTKVISSRTNLAIEFQQLTWNPKAIKGRLLRYTNRAVIQYSSELNTCWERFVVCKEACHLFIDNDQAYTKDPSDLVKALVSANICNPDTSKTSEEISEYLAEIAALELLFPFNLRREVYNAYKDGLRILQIANQFKIPAHYVEKAFSEPYRSKIDIFHY